MRAHTGPRFLVDSAPGAGINKAGQIVRFYTDVTGFRGFLRHTDGGFTTLDVLGAVPTEAGGIGGSRVVGYSSDTGHVHGLLLNRGEFWPIDVPGAKRTLAMGIGGENIVGIYVGSDNVNCGFLATE